MASVLRLDQAHLFRPLLSQLTEQFDGAGILPGSERGSSADGKDRDRA
jgi:hypothetical protein